MSDKFHSSKLRSGSDSRMPPVKKRQDIARQNEAMHEISRKAGQLISNFARLPERGLDDENWKECSEARRAFFAGLAQLKSAIDEQIGKNWQFGSVNDFTLLDVFAYLDRRSLDELQFSNYRFHLVISKKMDKQCLRSFRYAGMHYDVERGIYVTSADYQESDTGSSDQQHAMADLMSRCRSARTPRLDLGKVPLTTPALQEFFSGAPFVFTQKLRLQARNGAFDEAKSVLNHCLKAGIPELVMKDFTIYSRRRAPELGHDTGISEDDILRFCFEPTGDSSKRVLELESSSITSNFVERLLDYATRKEYDYGIKLVVLAHELQTTYEGRNDLWRASIKGRVIVFTYKYNYGAYESRVL